MRRPVDGEWLFTSPEAMCMTHLTRLVTVHGERRSADALCGTSQSSPVFMDPADETFICRRCHAAAERWDRPTFGLVPDSGCSITGGRRGRRGAPAVTLDA